MSTAEKLLASFRFGPEVLPRQEEALNVMMVTEGTYPYHAGGVGTWCQALIERLPEVSFDLLCIESNANVSAVYYVPGNVGSITLIPQWQGRDHEISELGQTQFATRWMRTSSRSIRNELSPLMRKFFYQVIRGCPDPAMFSRTLLALNRYWQKRDYRRSFRNRAIWDIYRKAVSDSSWTDNPSEKQLAYGLMLIQNLFSAIAVKTKPAHISHCTAASFCSLPAIIAKEENGTPIVLSEHGVYLRERLLGIKSLQNVAFIRRLYYLIIMTVVRASYHHADRILPVCDFNSKWEEHLGAERRKIRTIYNGVESRIFSPGLPERPAKAAPTIVSLARIDPLKDIETLIKAASLIKEKVPDVRVKLYGGVWDEEYHGKCMALHKKLDLGRNFEFAGHTRSPEACYLEGDLVVLSSISEAFPYAVVEAMMCRRAVVATDVGGVREALEGCGMIIEPRQPQALADACLRLLGDKSLREGLARKAMIRARSKFTVEEMVGNYLKMYSELAGISFSALPARSGEEAVVPA